MQRWHICPAVAFADVKSCAWSCTPGGRSLKPHVIHAMAVQFLIVIHMQVKETMPSWLESSSQQPAPNLGRFPQRGSPFALHAPSGQKQF